MPIYATRCKTCGAEKDVITRINEELPVCDAAMTLNGADTGHKCGGELEKVPSASNFSFKGGAPTPKFY